MWRARGVIIIAVTLVLSGCAGARTRQELSRLQSQVGLMEERLGQLERSSLSGFSSDSFTAPAASPLPAEALGSGPSPSTRKKAGAAGSLKPTTREIQQALKNAGFYQGAVDGKLGAITREAVKEFQRVHGLTDDGLVGKQTWAKLKAYADLPATSGELNAAETLK